LDIVTKKEVFTNPLYLESGRILEPYELVYETYGKLNDDKSNVVVVCHAWTGSHHAAGRYEGDRKAGWWDDLIGDGKGIDTTKKFVICVNVIGSCFGSTGPISYLPDGARPLRLKFPVITISDMVKAQRILFDRLGIYAVEAIIGGSMGGMQALCFAIEYPRFAKKVIVMAATYQTRPWTIAFNKIAMEAIRRDSDFKNGEYNPKEIKDKDIVGMAIGRMAGHISFLSPESMDQKFDRNFVPTDGLYELFGRFQVESYLEYNGNNFSKWFDPLSNLYLIKAINIFDATRNYDSLEDSLSHIQAQLHLISFKRDLLFLPKEMEAIKDVMCDIGKEELVSYQEIDSDYGHDAFLVEVDKFDTYIKEVLA
jgi:homoserine O-acetyltransferase